MIDRDAKKLAAVRAEVYAPRPKDKAAIAGLIGGMAGGIGLALFGRFYSIDMLSYPLIGLGVILSCIAGATVWSIKSRRRNTAAYTAELQKIVDEKVN